MEQSTWVRIAGQWAMRLGAPVPGLLPITLASTGRMRDAALVLLLGDQAWVDAPLGHLDAVAAALRGRSSTELDDPLLWQALASGPVQGPADHFWADHATALPSGATPVDVARLAELRALVTPEEWAEAGFEGFPAEAFGIEEDGRLVAASVLNGLWGWRGDVGVLVAPEARGRGLGTRVAAAALAAGVAQAGFAVFRVARGNAASRAIAGRLGLDHLGTNLLVPLDRG